MKRSDAILLLAKDIAALKDRKTSLETELRHVNDRLKETAARFRGLVPNADELIDDVPAAADATPAPDASLIKQIPAIMAREPDRAWSVNDVFALCPPETKIGTLRSSMSRLKLKKTLEKVEHGRYRLRVAATAASTAAGIATHIAVPEPEGPEPDDEPTGGDDDGKF